MNYDLELAGVRFAPRLSQGPFPHTRHDTLFQGLFDASVKMSANSPGKSPLNHALQLMRRAIEEGRLALQGLRSPETAPTNLEKAFADFGNEFRPTGARFQIFVVGRPKPLHPTIQEEIYLIGREAIANAFQHSEATSIEVEVVYLIGKLGVIISDSGCGIDPQAVRLRQNLHRGLLGMYERARNIGARLDIWSRLGLGTEVEIFISTEALFRGVQTNLY